MHQASTVRPHDEHRTRPAAPPSLHGFNAKRGDTLAGRALLHELSCQQLSGPAAEDDTLLETLLLLERLFGGTASGRDHADAISRLDPAVRHDYSL